MTQPLNQQRSASFYNGAVDRPTSRRRNQQRSASVGNGAPRPAGAERERLQAVCKRSKLARQRATRPSYPTPSHPILRRSLVAALVPIAPSVRVLHRVSLHAASFRNHSNGSDPSRPRPSASPSALALVFSLLLTISPASFDAPQRRTCRTLISYFRWHMVTSLRLPRACTARGRASPNHTGENVLDNLDIQ